MGRRHPFYGANMEEPQQPAGQTDMQKLQSFMHPTGGDVVAASSRRAHVPDDRHRKRAHADRRL